MKKNILFATRLQELESRTQRPPAVHRAMDRVVGALLADAEPMKEDVLLCLLVALDDVALHDVEMATPKKPRKKKAPSERSSPFASLLESEEEESKSVSGTFKRILKNRRR